MLDLCLVFCYRTASAIRSLRPIKLKTTMLLSSFKIRNVRSISFNVEPLVVTFRFSTIPFLVFHRLIDFIAQPTYLNDEILHFTFFPRYLFVSLPPCKMTIN